MSLSSMTSGDVPGWGRENRGVDEPRSQLGFSGWQLNRAPADSSIKYNQSKRWLESDIWRENLTVNSAHVGIKFGL